MILIPVRSRLVASLLIVAATVLQGQTRRPFPSITVRVTAFVARGDTLDITYGVDNRANSLLDLWIFGLETPANIVRLSAPTDTHLWETGQRHGDEHMPTWVAIGDNLRPGESVDGLEMAATGITDLVGYLGDPDLTQVADSVQDDLPHDQLREYATRDTTVGIVPAPTGTTPTLQLARLQRFLTRSCGSAAWITQAGVCNSLQQKLSNASTAIAGNDLPTARGLLTAFLSELDAQYGPQQGKHVTATAYALLRPNAVFLLSLL